MSGEIFESDRHSACDFGLGEISTFCFRIIWFISLHCLDTSRYFFGIMILMLVAVLWLSLSFENFRRGRLSAETAKSVCVAANLCAHPLTICAVYEVLFDRRLKSRAILVYVCGLHVLWEYEYVHLHVYNCVWVCSYSREKILAQSKVVPMLVEHYK